jgi:hypothetical protein
MRLRLRSILPILEVEPLQIPLLENKNTVRREHLSERPEKARFAASWKPRAFPLKSLDGPHQGVILPVACHGWVSAVLPQTGRSPTAPDQLLVGNADCRGGDPVSATVPFRSIANFRPDSVARQIGLLDRHGNDRVRFGAQARIKEFCVPCRSPVSCWVSPDSRFGNLRSQYGHPRKERELRRE